MIRAATAASLLLAPFALIGLQHLLRRPSTRGVRVPDGAVLSVHDPGFPALVETHVRTRLLAANRVEVLCDGDETYPRMLDDLAAARESIAFVVYFAAPGRLADRVGAVLRERARHGVRVHFLYDAFGGATLSEEYLRELRAAGVEVRANRPLHLERLWEAPHRSHVRCVVIDGQIGYTGGFGLADKWLGSGRQPEQWRETNVRLEGPAARHFTGAFAAAWADAAHELLVDHPRSLEPDHDRGAMAGLLQFSPEMGSSPAARFLALTIAAARERMWLASAYFVPDEHFSRMLCDAASRGVDVRILTSVAARTDTNLAYWAGRERYEPLLRSGVRIWEYQPAMMHAKTFVVDGRWCSIGAINFDNRSLTLMDDCTLMVLDEEVGRALERSYQADLARSEEVRIEPFATRPLTERMLERAASSVARLL